jgi:membrane protein DedA with SNARE-associated domain
VEPTSGRFVSILRTYAAFLAGTTRMHWRRFLAFNAAGGITWATIYGLAYYYFGSALGHRQASVDIALAAAAVALFVACEVGRWLVGER